MAELDTLEVKIQANATKAVNSVEKLAKKLDTLSTSIGKLDSNGINKFASGMTNLANGMNAMKNVKLPDFTRTAKGLKQFENINTAKLRSIANTVTPLANGLNAIANVQFNNSGLTNFVNALTRLSNSNISNLNVGVFGQVGNAIVGMSNQLQNAQQVSTNVIQLTNAIARLAGAGQNAVTVTNVLPAFGNALRDLFAVMSQAPIVATETTAFTTAIGNLAVAGNKVAATAAGLPALATALRSFFTTMSQAPTVSQNTIQMTQALAQLAAQGSRVGSATRNISSGINSMSASAKSAKPHIKSLTSQLAGLYARVWVVIRAFSWFKKAIDISSDLTEVENVVVNTFGQYSSELEKFSKEAITNYGISELTAKETASRFQAMGIAMGAPVKQMATMSTELTKLSADLASFYNVDQSDASRSLWSVFTGETEPMRKFGLDLTEASLKAYALKNGLDGNISSMTQMEKTMLRYQYVMENTKNVQGDFARTSQNWANQLRILQEQIKAIAGVWGNAFINMLKPLVQALNKALTAVYSFSEKVVNALGAIFGWKLEIQKAAIDDDFSGAADDANNLASGTKKAAKAAEDLKTHLLGIDELNVVEPDKDTGSGGSGGSGSGSGSSGAGSDNSLKFKVTETEGAFKSSIKNLNQLGRSISDSLSKSLESINWNKIYSKARNFGKGLANFLNGLITPRLFGNVGKTIAGSLNTALEFLDSFGETFDWANFGESIGTGISDFFKTFKWKKLASTLNKWVDGLKTALGTALETISWSDILEGGIDFLTELDLDTVSVMIGAFAWFHGGKEIVANSLKSLLDKQISLGIGSGQVKISTAIGLSITTAIIGYKIGNWLYDHIPTVQEWSDALAKWLFDGKDKINVTKAITVTLSGLGISIGTALLVSKLKTSIAGVLTSAATQAAASASLSSAGSIFSSRLGGILGKAGAVVTTAVVGYKAGNWLYDNSDFVQKTADSVVDKVMSASWKAITGYSSEADYTKYLGDLQIDRYKFNKYYGTNLTNEQYKFWSEQINNPWDIDKKTVSDKDRKFYMDLWEKTNGKKDESWKTLKKDAKSAQKEVKGKTVTYNAETATNGQATRDNFTLYTLSNSFSGAWHGKDVKMNADTTLNGQKTTQNSQVTNINNTFRNAWQGKEVKMNASTAVNGAKTVNTTPLKNINSSFKGAWNGKDVKLNAKTAVNDTVTANPNVVRNVSDNLKSQFSGKVVEYSIKTQADSKLRELGNNAATQIYAGMSQKDITFKLRQDVAAKGGDPLTNLINGTYSLKFQTYASGGFPEDGWFRASHGEYMGKFDNGQSVVANNEQITGGIAMGVREAVSAILAPYLAEIAQNTRETADKDFTANIDGRSLVSEVDRRRTRNGYSFT